MKRLIIIALIFLQSCAILPKPMQRGMLRPVAAYPAKQQKGNRIVSIAFGAWLAGFVYLYGIRK